jgi:Fic family protein
MVELIEVPSRIEPARLEEPGEAISDVVAELSAATAKLGHTLHPRTAANLAGLVRIMNAYYSNLIEGHNTRPREIERALAGQFDADLDRRNLQLEAAAHVRVQTEVDRIAAGGHMAEPTSEEFVRWLHLEFYRDAPPETLQISGQNTKVIMEPGQYRFAPEHEVAVGRHAPPSSDRVAAFMKYFEERYRPGPMGKAARIISMAAAHHRLNYIHPFLDGNGRVSRLMTHAMGYNADIAAHGLWSMSRGLARGLQSRLEYKEMMDRADTPRQGDLDGRGNLSQKALGEFVLWFLQVALDQVRFMSGLFDMENLIKRLRILVERDDRLKPEAARLLEEALIRGEFERGEIARITGLPERSARRVLNDLIDMKLLDSDTPKTAVSLRFPVDTLDILFPRLFPES